jgi:ActD protein
MYGLMAEFDTPEQLLSAGRRAHAAGYRHIDAYSPFPIAGLGEVIGFRSNAIPMIGLTGGVVGALTGYFMQFWVHTTALPINVGGRPLNSWPSFIPVTFELAVLFSALSMLVGLFILNGHPEPYHPVFNVGTFARATRDRFFLCIQTEDPLFDAQRTREFLGGLGAREVSDVPE